MFGFKSKFFKLIRIYAEQVIDWIQVRRPIARIAINCAPKYAAWGGGNQWVTQMTKVLRSQGFSVRFDLRSDTDCILIASSRAISTSTFGANEIQKYLQRNPKTVVVQRVNDSDKHRSSSHIDKSFADLNKFATFTIFISEWARQYHGERWFDLRRPSAVILNGADDLIFHAVPQKNTQKTKKFTIVTHHWSDHLMKGFDVYQELDSLIDDGSLPEVDFWLIGRWPSSINWRRAKLIGPKYGTELADLLRQCHLYISGSRWEAGGMHLIEAAQCGLPSICHEDGGGIVEVGMKTGRVLKSGHLKELITEARDTYEEWKSRMEYSPSGLQMCLDYTNIIRRLIASSKANSK